MSADAVLAKASSSEENKSGGQAQENTSVAAGDFRREPSLLVLSPSPSVS
jgi:hypothetical protein